MFVGWCVVCVCVILVWSCFLTRELGIRTTPELQRNDTSTWRLAFLRYWQTQEELGCTYYHATRETRSYSHAILSMARVRVSNTHKLLIFPQINNFQLISKKDKEQLHRMTQLMSASNHYKSYRSELKQADPSLPSIPLICVFCFAVWLCHSWLVVVVATCCLFFWLFYCFVCCHFTKADLSLLSYFFVGQFLVTTLFVAYHVETNTWLAVICSDLFAVDANLQNNLDVVLKDQSSPSGRVEQWVNWHKVSKPSFFKFFKQLNF